MRDYNNGVTPRARSYPKFCEVSPKKCEGSAQKMRGVTPKNARRHPNTCEESPQHLRGVTPTPARSHPENGGMAPHQFFQNYYFPEANQLKELTVHEGHMGLYHHWRTDDSSSSCFCAIVNVGKMWGVTPTDANIYMCEIITIGWRLARGVTPNFARCHPQTCEASPKKMRGVTPTSARSHPENGGMAPHQFFKNNSFPEAN